MDAREDVRKGRERGFEMFKDTGEVVGQGRSEKPKG